MTDGGCCEHCMETRNRITDLESQLERMQGEVDGAYREAERAAAFHRPIG